MRESSVKHTSAHVFNVNREIVMENVINLEPLCGIVSLFVLSSVPTRGAHLKDSVQVV